MTTRLAKLRSPSPLTECFSALDNCPSALTDSPVVAIPVGYPLANAKGMRAVVSNLGASLIYLETPDRNGTNAPVTLGYDALSSWQSNPFYFGSSIGRFGNRIANGQFKLAGKTYQLPTNNAPGGIPCHLHGGPAGFHRRIWQAQPLASDLGSGVRFTLDSAAGDQGHPGGVKAQVDYLLTEANELIWQASATCDSPTPLNLVHHSYWNLSGAPDSTVLQHLLKVAATRFLEAPASRIPSGRLLPSADTPLDFTQARPIAQAIGSKHPQILVAAGLDHCLVLDANYPHLGTAARPTSITELRRQPPNATLSEPQSGRYLEIITDQPALQLYSGNYLGDPPNGLHGRPYPRYAGIAIESQAFPDAPNHPDFPPSILLPEQTYRHTLIHRFGYQSQ